MASLRFSQIRATVGSTIHYIANKDKIISSRAHDVSAVLNYMGEEDSIERIYSFARHCSCNPDLAARQMDLYRARYYKNGDRIPKEGELLGLHFFLSFSEDDDPSEAVMTEIATKICEHPLFDDHGAFGACHFDKHCKHIHFFVSNFSATGPCKKLCMRHNDYNEIRKHANRLCVQYGLSIIDLEALRHNDPEYSAWIDGVIVAGKVTVHPEREEHKGAKHQKVSTRKIYYRWLKDMEDFNAEQERQLTKKQLSQKRAKEKYFWTLEEEDKPPKYYPVSGTKNKYYAVSKIDKFGRKRSLLELIIMLILVIYENEKKFKEVHAPLEHEIIKVKVDPKVQGACDSIRIAREMNIENPAEIADRIADVGKQMNALKKEQKRHENSIACHEKIISAWDQYTQVRMLAENANEPDADTLKIYKSAYAVLARNQVLTEDAFERIRIRYEFAKRKIEDYDKRLSTLKKQYHDLKKLDALLAQQKRIIEAIYIRNQIEAGQNSLDAKIRSAEEKRFCQRTGDADVQSEQQKNNKEAL